MNYIMIQVAMFILIDISTVAFALAVYFCAAEKIGLTILSLLLWFTSFVFSFFPAVNLFIKGDESNGLFFLITVLIYAFLYPAKRHRANLIRIFVAKYDVAFRYIKNYKSLSRHNKTVKYYTQKAEIIKKAIHKELDKGHEKSVKSLTKAYNQAILNVQEEEYRWKNFLSLKSKIKEELGY